MTRGVQDRRPAGPGPPVPSTRSRAAARAQVYRAMQNVTTPHPPERYPGLTVVQPGPGWPEWIIVAQERQSFIALGGEYVLGYTTVSGGAADGFVLEPGDLATKVRGDLPFHLAEWRVQRARGGRPAGGQRPAAGS